ncbi:hypothetical protein BDZ85DRAFT_280516 [Elsinoe ampelina]|uniref:Major facilitator superfamily (MFS) profile domain-containing protein n=1 Tax=Elsinoe ampelina TaxID=302913 RepID=A0A6A6GIP1_9PEZI|nr:hypothetical protein BDZ85DRAFT_280516 [Elsinoe ampelina]
MSSMASPEGKLAPIVNNIISNKVIDDSDDHCEYVDEKARSPDDIADLSGIEATAASKAAWLISLTVSIGGFLFGYDTGYISKSWSPPITSGGALMGAVIAGLTADKALFRICRQCTPQ